MILDTRYGDDNVLKRPDIVRRNMLNEILSFQAFPYWLISNASAFNGRSSFVTDQEPLGFIALPPDNRLITTTKAELPVL